MLRYTLTPIQEIQDKLLEQAGVRLLIKREDLNHPHISGNKWWKLKYNLEEALRQKKKTLLTFGGAYSNHIFATASAAYELRLEGIGIIRGEETLPLNPTLNFAKDCGMQLHFISREEYQKKNEEGFIKNLYNQFGDFYLIPEGGTNELAVKGCAEFAQIFMDRHGAPNKSGEAWPTGRQAIPGIGTPYDYLMLPVGTGGTMAGIIAGLQGEKEVIGVSVLKNGSFLKKEIEKLLPSISAMNPSPKKRGKGEVNYSHQVYGNWSLLTSYHHGGYAKVTKELLAFMDEMMKKHNLPLDPVYTGKLLWAVMEEVRRGTFRRGSTVLALHTGGLQGANSLSKS